MRKFDLFANSVANAYCILCHMTIKTCHQNARIRLHSQSFKQSQHLEFYSFKAFLRCAFVKSSYWFWVKEVKFKITVTIPSNVGYCLSKRPTPPILRRLSQPEFFWYMFGLKLNRLLKLGSRHICWNSKMDRNPFQGLDRLIIIILDAKQF